MSKTHKTKTKPVPLKYVPKRLTKKDKARVRRELKKSRRAYRKGKYYTRKRVSSFKSRVSKHILRARKVYGVEDIVPSKELAKKTGCSVDALEKIERKGMGAYYSSGSRPNQTAHSWGRARLASAITGGKSSAIDFSILEKGCRKSGTAYKLAKKARRVHKKGTRRVPQTKL